VTNYGAVRHAAVKQLVAAGFSNVHLWGRVWRGAGQPRAYCLTAERDGNKYIAYAATLSEMKKIIERVVENAH
jgi:hypothetical protein